MTRSTAATSSQAASPVRIPETVRVRRGPALLAGIDDGPGLTAHRTRYGELPRLSRDQLLALADGAAIRGRGGAGFPFAIKLRTAAERRRPVVVVNLSEGEPASAKDSVLALTAPHLVLDGARVAAHALGCRQVHVILPRERPAVADAARAAMAERPDRFVVHLTDGGFVGGQARAVLELMSGRPNLPVTAWAPEAVAGHRGRPTLLSNAETWAHLGLLALRGPADYASHGTADEPGTTLLTLIDLAESGADSSPEVVEWEYGAPLRRLLAVWGNRPVLVGGFHGTWSHARTLGDGPLSATALRAAGTPLGAGTLLAPASCPVDFTAEVVDYLAGQSARRCGPCRNGLPALADAMHAVAAGGSRVGPGAGPKASTDRVSELSDLVTGRGACAHPDGTARLARSLLATFPDEVATHARGGCSWRAVA